MSRTEIEKEEYSIKNISMKLLKIQNFINKKYVELDDYISGIMIALVSRSNIIALGPPGTAKSAVIRDLVKMINFDNLDGTPYFWFQLGEDIHPNNVFGAPDLEFYKKTSITRRNFKGFLPDSLVVYGAEFYRLNEQIANSGLITIMNEGEFKNGTEIIKTNIRLFMADTNFFPKSFHKLEEEDDFDRKLQAIHDRFLIRVMVKGVQDFDNQVKMLLMDDELTSDVSICINEIIYIQEHLQDVELPIFIAEQMVKIANQLREKHNIFISPRRLKNARNVVKAHAILNGRKTVQLIDLLPLKFVFWENQEDIPYVEDAVEEALNVIEKNAEEYKDIFESILGGLSRNLRGIDVEKKAEAYFEAIKDLDLLLDRILEYYPDIDKYEVIKEVYELIKKRKIDIYEQYLGFQL
jgi:MoxR-like ATPase